MCGIAGFIDPTLKNEERDPLLERMLQSIAHRGPDARGKYLEGPLALGHNRLSIIDLSADGNQPMMRGDNYIVYNGEIYNYREIRKDLESSGYQFTTQSDTEVILAAYEAYGTNCVSYFTGMWAFAIWDQKKQWLFCSRDRFGIKPFYFINSGTKFYFASEYKPLKLTACFSADLNYNQVARSLQLGWCTYNDETYFETIRQMEAGHNMIVKDGELTITKYWDIDLNRVEYSDHEEACYLFRKLLRDAVTIHMRSDVEVAICLSGGIDSSSLTSLIAEVYPDLKFHSFSIYYDGEGEVDERPFIKAVTDTYPQVQPHYYKPDSTVIPDFFEGVVEKSDVPITGSSPVSHYYLVKKIHESGIKVVLDGQGADEYLGGYTPAYYRRIADLFIQGKFFSAYGMLDEIGKSQQLNFDDKLKFAGKALLSVIHDEDSLYKLEFQKYYPFLLRKELLKPHPLKLEHFGKNRLDSYLFHTLKETSLPTILHYVDRMTMSFSVESRVPLLDHRLIEFAFSLPGIEKVNGLQTKSILRESLKDILPEKIYHRKDKKGFVTPGENKWLRSSLGWLLDLDYKQLDFLDIHKVRGLIDEFKKGSNKHARLVWRLTLLNYWLKKNA